MDIRIPLAKEFTSCIDEWFWHAMPNGRIIDSKPKQDFHMNEFMSDPEAIMWDSLKRGKNLLIATFPVVDLHPDPNCDY